MPGLSLLAKGLPISASPMASSAGERRLGLSDQLIEHRGYIARCGAPRQFLFDGKLEGAQMIATFQPDSAKKPVEVAESAVIGRLQVHPVIRRVTSFHDQMEPASSRFSRVRPMVCFVQQALR